MPDITEETARALATPPEVLALTPGRMRELGYLVVDRVIEHLVTLDEQRAISESSMDELAAVLGGPAPTAPTAIEQDLALLADVAAANQQHGDHPRYFARVPGPSSYPAILGEWLATGMQAVTSSWGGGSGPTAVELISLAWLRDALGLAATCEGILQSGGSLANATAIITARHMRGTGVIYLADQAHSSIKRAILAMGHPASDLRILGTDDHHRLPPASVAAAIDEDMAAGHRPLMVIATAGTTNTGVVDDLPALSAICQAHGVWLHVDGAYGGPAALSARGRAAMPGLELADSFVIDPHKWLFQPYDIACVFVSQPGALEQTFAMYPEYLADLDSDEPNMHNRSLELSRRGRAFKLWLTFRAYGLPTLAGAIDRGIGLAEYAEAVIKENTRLEVVTAASLGIVTFAGIRASDEDHVAAAAALTADGYAAATSTVLKGRTVLRLCIINPATTTQDIDGTIERLASYLP